MQKLLAGRVGHSPLHNKILFARNKTALQKANLQAHPHSHSFVDSVDSQPAQRGATHAREGTLMTQVKQKASRIAAMCNERETS